MADSLQSAVADFAFFKLTASEGKGSGETLQQFPLEAGDYVIADRGYCHASGIHYAGLRKAFVAVRLNPDGIVLKTEQGDDFRLLGKLKSVQQTGQIAVMGQRPRK